MNYVEILEHRLFNVEQKNAQLQKENEELKFRCADLHRRIQEHNTLETKRTNGVKRFVETPLPSHHRQIKEGE